jgi:hypothetical protein
MGVVDEPFGTFVASLGEFAGVEENAAVDAYERDGYDVLIFSSLLLSDLENNSKMPAEGLL